MRTAKELAVLVDPDTDFGEAILRSSPPSIIRPV